MKLETTFRSTVARRIFLLFVVCALLPLAAQAWLSWRQVSGQLEQQAEARLKADAKAAAMTLIERIQFLELDLTALDAGIVAGAGLEQAARGKVQRLGQRLVGLALVSDDGRVEDSLQRPIELPEWTPSERAFLSTGATLLTTRPDPPDFARVLLARHVLRPGEPPAVLVARVRPEFLWGGGAFDQAGTELFVFDESGHPLFSTLHERTPSADLAEARGAGSVSGSFVWTRDGEESLAAYRTLFMRPQFMASWTVARSRSRPDILAPVASFQRNFLLLTALTFWIVLMASARQIRRVLVPITELGDATRRVAARDFGRRVDIKSGDEFEQLGESFNRMTDSLEQHLEVQRGLHRIGVALTAENDSERLIETVLDGAQQILGVEAAAYFAVEGDRLVLRVCRQGGSEVAAGDLSSPVDRPRCAAAHAVQRGAPVRVDGLEGRQALDLAIDRELDLARGGRTRSLLALPLRDHEGQTMGVLQVMNPTGGGAGFDPELCKLAESIAAQAAVALNKNELLHDFRRLFVSVAELIALAIDEKSPYTAAHCRRVPVLTMMLADSACEAKEGRFADFRLTPDERFEVQVAALLHDCGKIVTPVHVIDKATKLETLFDRIELIDTRFEVLRRDAEVELLREALEGAGADPRAPELLARLQERLDTLARDREFVRRANVGVELMPEADRQEVRRIAADHTWSDPEGRVVPFLGEDEVENLTVAKGTLTAEEREIINDHIVVTIKMLEQIEYPRALRQVPALAGAHHERMDGKGFPRGLTREEIPIPGRMMGIADVFEALTDPDRPYKEGKSLQESLVILGRMAVEGHVDPELFQLFVHDGIYLRYAREFMRPEQIGEVDLDRVPGYVRREGEWREAS